MRTTTVALAAVGILALGGCGIQEHNAPKSVGGFAGASGEPDPEPPAGTGGESGSGGSAGGGNSGSGTGGSRMGSGGGGAGGSGGRGGTGGASGGSTGGTGGARADAGAPPPPTSNGPLVLGGVQVPREKAVVILHFGHSNMLGHGEEPEDLRPYFFEPQPRLWSYRGNGNFVQAVEPTASGGRARDTAGPGMALLRAAAAVAPDDYHFISIGLGVGSATTQDWSKGGLHYSRVIDPAMQLKGRVTFGAAIIMLGITDRHMPLAQQGGFADRLTKIAADVRADLGTPDLPVLHTDYEVESTGSLAVDGEIGTRFRPLILMLPMRIPRCAIIPTDMLGMQDDHHFNMAGQKEWSDRAIRILVDKGWAPWPAR